MNFQYSGKNTQHDRVWKTQQEHRDQTIEEREPARDYFCPDIALEHQVQFVHQRSEGCVIFFRRHKMNDLVGKILSVAQEKIARIGITINPASAAGADSSIVAAACSMFAR